MAQKALLLSAYQIEERRTIVNKILNERKPIEVTENEFLWAYFSSEQTLRKEIIFRSFIIKKLVYQNNKTKLIVGLTYEKSRQWFD
ncbi:hypothetical protein RV02_GL002920 [Enterococcus gilvus]|nr:hypothetical protein RV02_GL002920 [Enterococcus gilvus]